MADTKFTNWMLGVASAVIVGVGGMLMATIMTLREDMAVVKSTVTRLERVEVIVTSIEKKHFEYESRIRNLERDGTRVNITHGQ